MKAVLKLLLGLLTAILAKLTFSERRQQFQAPSLGELNREAETAASENGFFSWDFCNFLAEMTHVFLTKNAIFGFLCSCCHACLCCCSCCTFFCCKKSKKEKEATAELKQDVEQVQATVAEIKVLISALQKEDEAAGEEAVAK